jgi:hypothetical protein
MFLKQSHLLACTHFPQALSDNYIFFHLKQYKMLVTACSISENVALQPCTSTDLSVATFDVLVGTVWTSITVCSGCNRSLLQLYINLCALRSRFCLKAANYKDVGVSNICG